jgi:hypothetical protein
MTTAHTETRISELLETVESAEAEIKRLIPKLPEGVTIVAHGVPYMTVKHPNGSRYLRPTVSRKNVAKMAEYAVQKASASPPKRTTKPAARLTRSRKSA